MKAVLYKKSSPAKLFYGESSKPTPQADEILVSIRASSVNAADYRMMKMGISPKRKIFGADVAGVIEEVGKSITAFKVGDSVVADLSDHGFGGSAEYACAEAKLFVPIPEGLSFEQAASLPLAGTTALKAINHNNAIRKESKFLIVGSSGGVGSYAIQLAKNIGAHVTGVCSSGSAEHCLKLGADKIVDYKTQDLDNLTDRYDVILGINGDYPLRLYKKLLKKDGLFLGVGGSIKQILKIVLFGKIISMGSKKIKMLTAKSSKKDLQSIVNLADQGKIKIVIDKSYSLEQTADAFLYIEEQHAKGKIVIHIDHS